MDDLPNQHETMKYFNIKLTFNLTCYLIVIKLKRIGSFQKLTESIKLNSSKFINKFSTDNKQTISFSSNHNKIRFKNSESKSRYDKKIL